MIKRKEELEERVLEAVKADYDLVKDGVIKSSTGYKWVSEPTSREQIEKALELNTEALGKIKISCELMSSSVSCAKR